MDDGKGKGDDGKTVVGCGRWFSCEGHVGVAGAVRAMIQHPMETGYGSQNRLTRLVELISLLEARRYGCTVAELGAMFGVNPRTIRRDLEVLQEAGIPVYDEKKEGQTRWLIMWARSGGGQAVRLSFYELVALAFMERFYQAQVGRPFQDAVKSALDKVRASLPDRTRAFLMEAAAAVDVSVRGEKHTPHLAPILEVLTQALLKHRVCRVTYQAAFSGQTRTYRIEPLNLFPFRGGMYLFVRVPRFGDIRLLAVERIRELEMTPDPFEMPADFSPEAYFQDAFGLIREDPFDVRIRFTGRSVVYVQERLWHPSQQIKKLPDGDVELSFRAGGAHEITAWVLGYGPEAEVLEPDWLREAVIERLREALGVYI